MKRWLLHIISITIACLCYSCSDNEDLSDMNNGGVANDEEIVIRLGINSRADGGTIEGVDNETITNLKVWMVSEAGSASFYHEVSEAGGIAFDSNGVYEFDMKISIMQTGKYAFYVLANSDNISGMAFDENTSVDDLRQACFTAIDGGTGNVSIPMYGEYHSINISKEVRTYYAKVPIERVLAKLELFFAKKNATSTMTINNVSIASVPDKGFIVPQSVLNVGGWNNSMGLGLATSEDGRITGTVTGFGTREEDEKRFTKLKLNDSFLFENPEGCLNNNVAQSGNNHGYQVHIRYTLNGVSSEQTIYLTQIERNTIYQIYGLVGDKDAETQFMLHPKDWIKEDEKMDFTDIVTYSANGWESGSYALLEGYNLYLNNDENNCTAYMTFKVEAPVGAKWMAALTNNIDFELVGDAVSGDVGGNLIRLGVKAKDILSEVDHETQLCVYIIVGGRSIELDMTKSISGSKPGKDVNRYTIKQSF